MNVQGVIVNVLRDANGATEFLYLQRAGGAFQGQWWPVAGTCHAHEAPIAAALRELREETQLVPHALHELGREIRHPDGVSRLAAYVAIVPAGDPVVLNEEHSQYRWLPAQDVYSLVPHTVHPVIDHIVHAFVRQRPEMSAAVWRR